MISTDQTENGDEVEAASLRDISPGRRDEAQADGPLALDLLTWSSRPAKARAWIMSAYRSAAD